MRDNIWNVRGRGREDYPYFDRNPRHLLEAARDYFDWCDSHPIISTSKISKGSGKFPGEDETEKPLARMYVKSGLLIYLGISNRKWDTVKAQWEDIDDEMMEAIEYIENVITTQQIEGGAANIFNTNLVSRINKLADNTKSENTNVNYDVEVTKEEAKNISKSLEEEV